MLSLSLVVDVVDEGSGRGPRRTSEFPISGSETKSSRLDSTRGAVSLSSSGNIAGPAWVRIVGAGVGTISAAFFATDAGATDAGRVSCP